MTRSTSESLKCVEDHVVTQLGKFPPSSTLAGGKMLCRHISHNKQLERCFFLLLLLPPQGVRISSGNTSNNDNYKTTPPTLVISTLPHLHDMSNRQQNDNNNRGSRHIASASRALVCFFLFTKKLY
jgi:hypothetical protein